MLGCFVFVISLLFVVILYLLKWWVGLMFCVG